MAVAIDKRSLNLPAPTGGLVVERARVIRHVKANESSRMVRLQPQRTEVSAPGVYPQRWWRVDFNDGSCKMFYVEGREVRTDQGVWGEGTWGEGVWGEGACTPVEA